MISIEEMKWLEANCGISEAKLMENAGKGCFRALIEYFGLEELRNKSIIIVAYHSRNSGDGFVLARELEKIKPRKLKILFIGDESKMNPITKANWKKVKHLATTNLDLSKANLIIDALLGFGRKGKIKEPIKGLIKIINKSKAFKVSIDLPTGIEPSKIKPKTKKMINADLILSLHDLKICLLPFAHKVKIVDIGIRKDLLDLLRKKVKNSKLNLNKNHKEK